MITLRVKDGTAVGTKSMCTTCKHAHLLKGYRESEEMVYCAYVWERMFPVPFKVRECSNYEDENTPTWKQMEELAIEIRPSKTNKSAGFRVQRDNAADEAAGGTEEVYK